MSFFETDKDYSKKLRGKKSRQQLEDKAIRKIKARININIRKIIESEGNYYKPVSIGNFWNIDYTEYASNGNRNKTLSVKNTLN